MSHLNHAWRTGCEYLLNGLLGDSCLLCRQTVSQRTPQLLCPYCWAAMPRNITACHRCAIPLDKPGVCGTCQKNPPPTQLTLAAFTHTDAAQVLVHALKFQNSFRAGICLAQGINSTATQRYKHEPWPELLVPMPQSYLRQLQRGFNQASWLARQLRSQLNIPIYPEPIRRRHTPSQQSQSRKDRLRLSHHSFSRTLSSIPNHVAIVDDVITTGASAHALANFLIKQGIQRVDVWAATRTP